MYGTILKLLREVLGELHPLVKKMQAKVVHIDKELDKLDMLSVNNEVKFSTISTFSELSCIDDVNSIVQAGGIGELLSINIEHIINKYDANLSEYPLPNILPNAYNVPYGPFQYYIYRDISTVIDYLTGNAPIEVEKKTKHILPFNLADDYKVQISEEKLDINIGVSFSRDLEKHIVTFNGSSNDLYLDLITGEFTFKDKNASLRHHRLLVRITDFVLRGLRDAMTSKSNTEKLINLLNGVYRGNGYVARGRMVAAQMDSLLSKLEKMRDVAANIISSSENKDIGKNVLITGANGTLGRMLVKDLTNDGYHVRAFVRKLSNIKALKNYDIDVYYGDINDYESLDTAFENIDYVIHAAADTNKTIHDSEDIEKPVNNIVSLCKKHDIRRLIYISTCNVYEIASKKTGSIITEESMLEPHPEKRGYYTLMKLAGENIITGAMKNHDIHAVCLRPGTFYGETGPLYTPLMGLSLKGKLNLVIGNGTMNLPLVYIRNIVDAVKCTINNEDSTGNIYNITDDQQISKKYYIENLLKKVMPGSFYIYMPYAIFYLTVLIQELLCRILRVKPVLTIYRLGSSQTSVVYDVSKIKQDLHWVPPYSVEQAFENIIKARKD